MSSQPLCYNQHTSAGVTDYFFNQGDHTAVYQVMTGLSQYFSHDRDSRADGTELIFDASPLRPLFYKPNMTAMEMYDWMQGQQ